MKLQWSIQSSHTRLVRSQVTYLTRRNEHIWPFTNVITLDWKLYIWLPFFTLLIKKTTQIFEKRCHKHFERTLTIEPLALAPYILIQIAFPFSSSNTSICDGFFSSKSLFEIDICRDLWKEKKKIWGDI